MRAVKIAGWIVVGLAGATALGFVLGLVVMLLWNALMPAIFGLPEITYWQSVGLFILAHLLFKSPGGPRRPGGDRRWRSKWREGGGRERFAHKVREHLSARGSRDGEGCGKPPVGDALPEDTPSRTDPQEEPEQ